MFIIEIHINIEQPFFSIHPVFIAEPHFSSKEHSFSSVSTAKLLASSLRRKDSEAELEITLHFLGMDVSHSVPENIHVIFNFSIH